MMTYIGLPMPPLNSQKSQWKSSCWGSARSVSSGTQPLPLTLTCSPALTLDQVFASRWMRVHIHEYSQSGSINAVTGVWVLCLTSSGLCQFQLGGLGHTLTAPCFGKKVESKKTSRRPVKAVVEGVKTLGFTWLSHPLWERHQ